MKSKQRKEETGGPLFLSIPIITFGLGCWQIKRLYWKRGLIEELEERTGADPIPLSLKPEDLENAQYTRVTVKGKFDHRGEMFLANRNLVLQGETTGGGIISSGAIGGSTSGFHVVTPFVVSGSGKRILVDRGWVPKKARTPDKRPLGQTDEEVELIGLIRVSEKQNGYQPDNEPQIGRWFFRDVEHMAKVSHCLPIFIDVDVDNTIPGGPIGGQTQVQIRNEHFNYILTWFSLSVVTGWLWKNMGRLRAR